MAYLKAANDKAPIRHDTAQLFSDGENLRDVYETQVMSIENGSLYFTTENISRVIYKAVSNSYIGAGDLGISVRDAYEGEIDPSGDAPTNDYMLDWGRARFNTVTLQAWDDVKDAWVTSFTYAMTKGPEEAFANRSTNDTAILDELKDYVSTDASATYGANFYNNWEYQCALYNWQYPEGASFIQYLFGNDTLNGTRKNDHLNGGAGNDTLSGGVGDDVLNSSFGQDTMYGDSGNDVLLFTGGSSIWDYKAGTDTARGAYKSGLDQASGGSGKDYFVFELPSVNFHGKEAYYPTLPDIFAAVGGTAGNYNPFLSQSQNATPLSLDAKSYGVSLLTFRTRILDFKVGEDKLDLSNFGIDQELITNKALGKLSGTAFVAALNAALKLDGYQITVGKSGFTSNNTTLFVQEALVDTNSNGRTNDTLVEIQLVGLTNSAITMKLFGDAPVVM